MYIDAMTRINRPRTIPPNLNKLTILSPAWFICSLRVQNLSYVSGLLLLFMIFLLLLPIFLINTSNSLLTKLPKAYVFLFWISSQSTPALLPLPFPFVSYFVYFSLRSCVGEEETRFGGLTGISFVWNGRVLYLKRSLKENSDEKTTINFNAGCNE